MSSRNEDEVWRSIVENYGDQPDVEPLPEEPEEPEPVREASEDSWDTFVPPTPPPVPHPPPVRMAAWIGLFGSPAVLLLATVLAISLPGWMGYILVGSFVGGFLYLVVHMQRGPRDPGDDGARV